LLDGEEKSGKIAGGQKLLLLSHQAQKKNNKH